VSWPVAVGLRPAEFHEKARGRRLKAGGSQDWLPHRRRGFGQNDQTPVAGFQPAGWQTKAPAPHRRQDRRRYQLALRA
jgi:hypothetical protein